MDWVQVIQLVPRGDVPVIEFDEVAERWSVCLFRKCRKHHGVEGVVDAVDDSVLGLEGSKLCFSAEIMTENASSIGTCSTTAYDCGTLATAPAGIFRLGDIGCERRGQQM